MVRLLVFAMLVWGAYRLVKKLIRAYFASFTPGQHPQDSNLDAELIQDPQCGAYFMKQKGVRGFIDGKEIHFCSQECYERYRQRGKK
jgi:YHS domain-containing protein